MSPLEIEVTIRAYYCREQTSKSHFRNKAYEDAYAMLEKADMIFYSDECNCWITTQKGDAYVGMLMDIGVPRVETSTRFICPNTGATKEAD